MKPLPNKLIYLIALILLMTGPGCQPVTPPVQLQMVALPLPARPVLPAIPATELTCLSDEVYSRLANRNRLLRHYAEELEVIVKSSRPPLQGP